ncbi:MAG TPA: BlaI/MecI/CopY family transcriptional regulator [Chthoniobacterales bacterium]|jgi:BlaI family penicillinase repressor
MKNPPKISESEWSVMEIAWESAPVAAAEIIERLAQRMKWKHQTIRTLLARLVKKGALASKPDGNRYLYHPLVRREQCVHSESESFLNRVFGGAGKPLLVHFATKADLTKEEIRELKRILSEREGQK